MRYPALNATGQTVISRMGQVYSFTRQVYAAAAPLSR